MPNGLVNELKELKPPEGLALPTQDVRARRPALLRGLVAAKVLRRLTRVAVLMTLDIAGVMLAIFTALLIKSEWTLGSADLDLLQNQTKDFAPLACLVTVLLFARSDLYTDRAARPGFARIIASLCQTMLVILVFALIEGHRFSSYYIFYGGLVFALVYVTTFRAMFEQLTGLILRAGGYHRRAVLVGTGPHIEAVAHALKGSHSEIHPVGFVSLTPRPENGLKNFGPLEQLEERFDDIDEVLIADPDFPQDQAVELVDRCHRAGIRVRVAPSTMEILMDRVEFVPGQTLPLFELKPPVFEGFDFAVKRSFDLLGAVLLLLLLSPVLVLIALAVKLTSRGTVLYRSQRPGIGGAPFACLKFRTMYADAERLQRELEHVNEAGGAIFKIRRDPRVTPVGRFLRRWSLDELPQLFNVLRGEMSLVGPRPLPQRDYDRLEEWHRKRYLVLPGMTGLWQVSGRSELDFEELVRLDFLYLESWSVWLDLTILLKTIPAVFRQHGAW